MDRHFSLSPAAERALRILESHGYESYVVGGCVRDFLMNTQPHDFDITSAATPDEIKHVFRDYHVIPTGEKHGTITVMMDGEPLEITTFRKDGDYLDGRHPENVQFTSAIEEDLKRRDFTINAMAYSPARGLKDPFHGQEDLQNGVLRCVGHAPTRFTEDALRLLRALRFAARLQFAIEPGTADALHALAPAICTVSRERILSEMNGLLLADGLETIMVQFADVVAAVIPELAETTRAPQWADVLRSIRRAPKNPAIRWAALLSPLGPERARDTLAHLKASRKLTEDTGLLVQYQDASLSPQTVKPMLRRIGPEAFAQLAALQTAQGRESNGHLLEEMDRILSAGECYRLSMLAVTGSDLKAIGITGRDIGTALDQLLTAVIDGTLPNEKEALMSAARAFSSPSLYK